MDYEQKYNKMLDDARYWHDVSEGDIPAVLEEIFPELRESEDERIRKEILEYFQQFENEELRGVNISGWIDWLEKQGQKSAEWKQENREELTEFENAMMHIGRSFFEENAGLDPNDTATIKEQAELLLELAPKTEWSEEDERAFYHVLSVLEEYGEEHPSNSKFVCNWLKSIKARMGGDKV